MNRSAYQGLLISLLCWLTAGDCFSQEYDIVINNCRVMDPETQFDGIRNVGINDGKISCWRINFSKSRIGTLKMFEQHTMLKHLSKINSCGVADPDKNFTVL